MPTGIYTRPAIEARFWAKVDKTGDCWLWTGAIARNGYGQFGANGATVYAHRWSYEHHIGKVPEGLQLDHLCRMRACVRPSHLEPVTQRINLLRGEGISARNARKTECPQGHPYNTENTLRRQGTRRCRRCEQARDHARRRRTK